jgi:acyl-CoA synthetase (AMP-forming)/AMP-acid ligase II
MSTATRIHEPEARVYYARGFWRREDMWEDFEARARAVPDKPALICGDSTLTFDQLGRAATALSDRLSQQGVQAGHVVGLCGRHSIEAVVALMACIHRGAVMALFPPMFSEQQLQALITQCSARALLGFGSEASIEKCLALAEHVPLTWPRCSTTSVRYRVSRSIPTRWRSSCSHRARPRRRRA